MCKFCDDFEFTVSLCAKSELPYTFSAAYLDHVIIGGRIKGRTVHYMEDGVGFQLNYCPECGKKLLEG